MQQHRFSFQKNFYWGAATSSHQVEGETCNDWSEWEKQNASCLARRARRQNWPAHIAAAYPNPLQEENYVSGKACGHYYRFREDFDLAKELGHNAHRFSVEWSRVEPQEGAFDAKELAHYREVLTALRERGLEPFLTIYHWACPLWFRDKGAWLHPDAPKDFARLAGKLAEAFADPGIKFWLTINEPLLYATNSFLRGIWPPQKKNPLACLRALNNLAAAHRLSYGAIKCRLPDAQIGLAKNNVYFESAGGAVNNFLKRMADWWWNERFLDKIAGQMDFVGLNHYFHSRINYGFNRNANEKISDTGWELYPEALYHVLLDLKKYRLPIYITENGLADARDAERGWFVAESLRNVARAMHDGADVRGYFYWSLLDNFEWDKGFWPRFGLVETDYRTGGRRVRASAESYAKICRDNALIL